VSGTASPAPPQAEALGSGGALGGRSVSGTASPAPPQATALGSGGALGGRSVSGMTVPSAHRLRGGAAGDANSHAGAWLTGSAGGAVPHASA